MYHLYVQGKRDGKGGTRACHYESMTEQTNTFRSTYKYIYIYIYIYIYCMASTEKYLNYTLFVRKNYHMHNSS